MIASTLKRYSLSVSKQIGLSSFVEQSVWRRQRLLVLCFHGVSLGDEHEWNPTLYVSPAFFERRLELLRRHRCSVLPLDEAVRRLASGTLPDRAVALTFDDGYFDFLHRAWPLLKLYGYPATVYLTTMRCEHNFPIVRLTASYLLWRRRDGTLEGDGIPGLEAVSYPLRTPAERSVVVERMDAEMIRLKLPRADKDGVVALLANRLGFEYEKVVASKVLTLMNPAEVATMSRAGVAIELHTHRHRTPEDPAMFREEILQNRTRIEAMTGKRPTHFCYPSGCYRATYLPILEAEGVVSATTCEPGLAARHTNPLLMPRLVDTSGFSEVEFEGWLTGMASWLARTPAAARQA